MKNTPEIARVGSTNGSATYLPPDNSVPLDDILAMIRDPRWTWVKNNRCKYIGVQIDTRSMRCQLTDRDGHPITLKDLSRQCDEYLLPNAASETRGPVADTQSGHCPRCL